MLGLRWPTRKVYRDCHFCGQSNSVQRAQVTDWQCDNELCRQRNLTEVGYLNSDGNWDFNG